MKKWLVLLLFFIPTFVFAETCDDKLYDLNVASSNLIKVNYSYNNDSKKMDVKVLNIPNDFYVMVDDNKYTPVNNQANLGAFAQGDSFLVSYHYNSDMGCGRGTNVNKLYIRLPYYNPFSKDVRCKTREGLSACNEFYPRIITAEIFNEAIYYYDERIYSTEVEQKPVKKKITIDPWYYTYRYYLIGAGVLIIVLIAALSYRIYIKKQESEL